MVINGSDNGNNNRHMLLPFHSNIVYAFGCIVTFGNNQHTLRKYRPIFLGDNNLLGERFIQINIYLSKHTCNKNENVLAG